MMTQTARGWSRLSASSSLRKSTVSEEISRQHYSLCLVVSSYLTRQYYSSSVPHVGPALSSFLPVTDNEVRRLLSKMPSKSSPLNVLPCSLLKSCADVFAPVITRLANLSFDRQVPVLLQARPGTAAAEEGRLDSSSPVNYRPTCRPYRRYWNDWC